MTKLIFAALLLCSIAVAQETPSVVITSKSSGGNWNVFRDQSQEMAKDLAKDCPSIRLTTDSAQADYQIVLNHIEVGLMRENQFSITDAGETVLATGDKGSIKGGAKKACSIILADWADQPRARETLTKLINGSFRKESVVGYAEISGDVLTIHSENASAMRFHMALANAHMNSLMHRARLVTCIYTNDADLTFTQDLKKAETAQQKSP